MKKSKNTVYLIEDDDDLAKALETLLTEENYICSRYRTAESFIEESANLAGDFNFKFTQTPLIVVLLMYDSHMSGINLFNKLIMQSSKKLSQVIFLTGHGDLQMAVDALKRCF